MSGQYLFLPKPYARIHTTELESVDVNCVRSYKQDPYSIALQIRVRGKKQSRYAHVNLTKGEAQELAHHLASLALELAEEGKS